jgi:hypothetical protein
MCTRLMIAECTQGVGCQRDKRNLKSTFSVRIDDVVSICGEEIALDSHHKLPLFTNEFV